MLAAVVVVCIFLALAVLAALAGVVMAVTQVLEMDLLLQQIQAAAVAVELTLHQALLVAAAAAALA
tara:strand:+ start:1278 stop:1475 length:198 start_codon:yes stop_codon:yes gene_type:complete